MGSPLRKKICARIIYISNGRSLYFVSSDRTRVYACAPLSKYHEKFGAKRVKNFQRDINHASTASVHWMIPCVSMKKIYFLRTAILLFYRKEFDNRYYFSQSRFS